MHRRGSGNTVDEAIEQLQGVVTHSSSSRLRLRDEDNDGSFRQGAQMVELDDFRFHDGSSHIAVRPRRQPRVGRKRQYAA